MIRKRNRERVFLSKIARRAGRGRKTIRQIVTAPGILPPKKSRQPKAKARNIDPYVPYLERRIAEGVLNARKLYREILAQGYPGRVRQVRRFVHQRCPVQEPAATTKFETAPGE